MWLDIYSATVVGGIVPQYFIVLATVYYYFNFFFFSARSSVSDKKNIYITNSETWNFTLSIKRNSVS